MGYREYFYKIKKRDLNKIRKMTPNELIEWCKMNNIELDEYEDNKWYASLTEILEAANAKMVFEFGKWYENSDNIADIGKPLFKNVELQEHFSDYNPYIVGKEAIENAIEWQRVQILKYFNNLLLNKDERQGLDRFDTRTREQRMEEAIRSKITEWDNPWTKPYHLKEGSDEIVKSWLYEYTIFELVKLYNTTNWKTECVVFMGW